MLSVDIIVIMPPRRSTPKTSKPSLKAKKKIIEVSKAIDIEMEEGIYSFVLVIYLEKPDIEHVKKIKVIKSLISTTKFSYMGRYFL